MEVKSLLATTSSVAALMVAASAWADETSPKAADKSQYTLFNPTPRDQMPDFSTDRPTKSNVPYTVDAGHFQYEGDFFIYGYNNISTPDTQFTQWIVGNPTFKLGLLNNLPACTDLTTKPWVQAAGVEVLEQPFFARGNIATAGGCFASHYLAAWIIVRAEGEEAAAEAIRTVAPVSEKEEYVARALQNITPYLPSPQGQCVLR